MLHINTVHEILAPGVVIGSLRVCKLNGEIVTYKNCVAISRDRAKGYYIIKLLANGQKRHVPEVLILELNDEEVYL